MPERERSANPLLYSTLWNAALFAVILMGCHLLEETLLKVWHGQSIAESFSETVADPRAIFATALVVFVVLIRFFFAKGLIEILGEDEIKRLLLRSRSKDSTPTRAPHPADSRRD